MKTIATIAAACAALTLATGAALASDDARCGSAPRSAWRTSDDVKAAAEALGYSVRRVKTDDGCFEVYATDKNNRRVEVYFDPVSLKVVRVENKS